MHAHLQRAHEALQGAAAPLTLEQLTERPPGKWTIAEILEHLGRAFSGTAAGAQRALTAGRPSARRLDFPGRLRTFVVVQCGYLPAGRPAPASTMPVGIDPATALWVATDSLRRMDSALNETAAQFGAGARLMDHPILGPLTTREWRKFHWIHTRHHVRQIIARVRKV